MLKIAIWISVVLLIVICSILFLSFRKSSREKNQYAVFLKSKTSSSYGFFMYVYEFFSHWFLTKRFMLRIRKRHELVYPGDNRRIINSTLRILFLIMGVILLSILFLFTQKFSFYGNVVTILTIYFAINEVVYLLLESKSLQLNKGFDKFIANTRHYYFEHGMVDEAVEGALNEAEADKIMKLHGKKILDVLTSSDLEGELVSYNDTIPNRFLRTFMANCTMVLQYGDSKKDGESIFLGNLRDLKRELSIETLTKQRRNVVFSGMTFMCILPLYAMPFCKKWCISNVPSIESFFSGSLGLLAQIIIFVSSLLCYILIRKMKDDTQQSIEDHPVLDYLVNKSVINNLLESITSINYSRTLRTQNLLRRTGENLSAKKFYLKRMIFAIFVFFFSCGLFIYGHELDKNNILTKVKIDETASSGFISSDYNAIVPTAISLIQKNIHKQSSVDDLTEQAIDAQVFRNIDAAQFTGQLVHGQVQRYHNEYFKWYELIIAFVIGIGGFFIPFILLKSKESALKMRMDDEVIQFQSVILMLIHLDRITVETILEWMCDFAVIFKPSIQECLDNYSAGDIEALEKLMEDEPYPSFQRIIKNLIACDRIKIDAAFNEISVDRLNYQETRKQENEIQLNKKASNASIISFVPFYAVIFFYTVIPFLYGVIKQFSNISGIFELLK